MNKCTTVELCITRHWAARFYNDFQEGQKSVGTNSTSTIHKGCIASCKHPRKTRSVARENSNQNSWSPKSLRHENRAQISRRDCKTRAMRPRRCVGTCQTCWQAQKKEDKATFYSPTEKWIMPAASTKKPEEREFVVDCGASMPMVSKKDLSSAELETGRISKNPITVVTANGEVLAKEKATVCVRELDLFVTVMLLENTPGVLSLGKLWKEFGYSYHWTSGQKPHNIKQGKKFHCDTSKHVPFVVPGLSTSSSTSSTSPTSSSQETVTHTEIPATSRSEQASEDSSPRGNSWHESTAIEIQIKMSAGSYRVVSCKVCRIGWRSSSMDWLMKVFQNIDTLPVLLMNYPRSSEQKWYRTDNTITKTGIATSAWGRKLRGLLADDASVQSCPKREIWVTWKPRITKFSVEDVNHEKIIDTLWWYESWLLSGEKLTHAKQKLLRKHKGAWKSSWSRIRSLKSFTLTIPLNLAKPVKIFPGITVRQHLIESRTKSLADGKTPNERRFGETFKISCLMGRPSERRFGIPFNGPVIPFGAMVEYHPISAKDLSRLHQFGMKVLPGTFLGYVLSAGGIRKGHNGCRHWGVGNDGRIRNLL